MKLMKFSCIQQYKQYCLSTRRINQTFCCSTVAKQSESHRLKVGIVGGGPAGFYAAQYILKHLKDCEVDVIEKLPVPFGLVRYGVAPDHPEVKNVINTFNKTAENPRFRFLGNLAVGTDIALQELRENYHAVLLAYGAEKDRRLNIPNEDQSNVISARKFVAWYNGLPGADNLKPDLSGKFVTIIGQGNVAIDVARMLLSPLDLLKETDITEYALETLARSRIEQVFLVGRRSPLQVAFTIKELREMLKLPNLQTKWRVEDFEGIRLQVSGLQRPRKRLTELMLKNLDEQVPETQKGNKLFSPIFFRAPSRVEKNQMEFKITKVENNLAVSTDGMEYLPADLIMRSIGYQSVCVDPSICFDNHYGQVVNKNGRVLLDEATQTIDRGLYVAGWLATGPTGVLLTTMNGAFAVAKNICDDVLSGKLDVSVSKPGLDIKNKRVISWNEWKKLDDAEVKAGKVKGKPREKIVDIEKMLEIAGV